MYVTCYFFELPINLQDGSTPLNEASLSGSLDIVDTLLSAGAAVDQEDEVWSRDVHMHILREVVVYNKWCGNTYSCSIHFIKNTCTNLGSSKSVYISQP